MHLKIQLLSTMESLYTQYLSTKKNSLLTLLKQCMETYIEAGFFKKEEDDEFHKIWNALFHIRGENVYREGKSIKTNKMQIRSVLMKWNPKRHSMGIQDVVNDILEKVESEKVGRYDYWTEYKVSNKFKKFSYILCVDEIGAVLYDEQKKLYYDFVK